MSGNSDYEKPIPSKSLKEALTQASAVLGSAAQDAMFFDLELNGINFKDTYYTLREMQDVLRMIFGQDGATLLMQRIEKVLKD